MACKKCGDPKIDKKFKCNRCHVETGTFKWCVITKVHEGDGNQYDEIIDLAAQEVEWTGPTGVGRLPAAGLLSWKRPVFRQGEIFPMEPDFERELGWGRKASKWDLEYEVFPARQYKKAILRALKADHEATREKTNLDFLEEKSLEKEVFTEKEKKIRSHGDPFKLVYDWIKQDHISLKEAKELFKVAESVYK